MKTNFFILFLVIVGLAGFSNIAISALYNGNDYQVVSFEGTWDEATTDIFNTLGSQYYLATITSAAEQAFIESILPVTSESSEYWLGGFQNPLATTVAAANWEWVNGEGLFWDNGPVGGAYANWGNTAFGGPEPNDFYGAASEQHLAILSNFSWNDEGDLGVSNITGYVAEAVPIPGAVWLLGSGLVGLVCLRRKMRG